MRSACRPMSSANVVVTPSAASSPMAWPVADVRTAGTACRLRSRARGVAVPIVQRPVDGGERGAPGRSRLPAVAGAPAGPLGAQTAALALLRSGGARAVGDRRRAAHPAARHRGPSAQGQRCRCAGSLPGGELYPPLRCVPQPPYPLPLLHHRRGLAPGQDAGDLPQSVLCCPADCARPPLELIAHLPGLIPPPRRHRRRCPRVLAPDSPPRAAAVVLGPDLTDDPSASAALPAPPSRTAPSARSPVRCLWVMAPRRDR